MNTKWKGLLKNQISSKKQFLFHWKKSNAQSINKCLTDYYCWAKQNVLRFNMPKYGTGKGKGKNTVLITKKPFAFHMLVFCRAVSCKHRLSAHEGGKKAGWGVNASLCSLPAQVRGAESGRVSEKQGLRATVLRSLVSRSLHFQWHETLLNRSTIFSPQFPSWSSFHLVKNSEKQKTSARDSRAIRFVMLCKEQRRLLLF